MEVLGSRGTGLGWFRGLCRLGSRIEVLEIAAPRLQVCQVLGSLGASHQELNPDSPSVSLHQRIFLSSLRHSDTLVQGIGVAGHEKLACLKLQYDMYGRRLN